MSARRGSAARSPNATGRRVVFDTKGHYTPLFFLDEAVAFAAGHRPCAECRRADFLRFKRHFNRATGRPDDQFVPAREIDAPSSTGNA